MSAVNGTTASPVAPEAASPAGQQQNANVQPAGQANAAPSTTASLYVGELDPSVTEAILFELFNMVGPVASIRVCRDAVTRRSLGYSYVNYHNAVDADRALETLNYTLIKGKPCRIMWSQRDPALRKAGTGNIFIKNLDASIDNKALHDTFSAFGNILSCKVATEDGVSRGYGFVHFETYEAAENAIKHVNGMLLNDKKVFVGHHIPKKERQSKVEELKAQFTNVYVKNLDISVTLDEMKEMFTKFGAITSAVLATDENGVSRGFGFVNFEDHEQALQAVESLNETEFKGKKLYVGRAQKKSEREEELKRQYEQAKLEKLNKYQGVNLYVKNLEDDVDDDKLTQEFSVYGVITSAKVMRDEKGISKGFGFVCFSSPDEATKAVTEMNGRMWGTKPIYVALAQRKEVRKKQLEAQASQRNQLRMQQGMPAGGPGSMYPGAPMYYAPGPGFPPARGGMVFPQGGMVPRPRWAANQQNQPGSPMGGQYPPMPPQPFNNNNNNMQGNRSRGPRQGQRGGHQGRGRGGYKYGGNPRGNPQGAQPAQQAEGAVEAAPASPAPEAEVSNELNPGALAAADPEQQKQMLGEKLFPMIERAQPELAGKITGMLLEMDNAELLHLIESSEALDAKINEAVSVLKEHGIVQSQDTTEESA
ncbi:polyadenylate binding protein [Basidiobolus meristosporus CBS 931.73]|uniref:Polyadenylate-binding protein n=1 Tax=Basidiobolus meristosporus CBS 931.73 TaxID=1314790 RepID=A0A1Y1XVX9_9FUNG|nr:polyadenylate binding protein [Basidiobolus meristosporus CBS 931.73]|eukprot:ORX89454.1 polyadenylate binding protein [Basidiobolus meristosporus CBS 931.73]